MLDILPSVLFVVDSDIRLLYANAFGESLISMKYQQAAQRHTEDILACEHSFEGTDRCGTSPSCADCLIRNSVKKVLSTGETIRNEIPMTIGVPEKKVVSVLLTAGLFESGSNRSAPSSSRISVN